MKKNAIKTFNTNEFLDEYMHPAPHLSAIIAQDYGEFFMLPVQDMIRFSKLPVPPTRASTHTLIFLTSGIATMNIGFQHLEIGANECLIVAAGQVFSYDKYEINEGFICSFSEAFLVGKIANNDALQAFNFLRISGNPIIKPNAKTANYIAQTLQRITDAYTDDGLKNPTLIAAYFMAVLYELNTAYQPLFEDIRNKAAVNLTNAFKHLLHQHIKTTHSASDYAKMLHISPNHLNKSVKIVTNKSVSTWISETLILEAKILLFQTKDSISDIAIALGIEDASYFSRLFKAHEGISPLSFRKMIDKSHN